MGENLEQENTRVTMLDPYKIWKKLYFSTEEILTSTMRNYVSTEEFATGIDFILNSYLQYLKFQNEYVHSYMEESPFSSKRDIARVAELVVSLENKVDGIENNLESFLDELDNRAEFIAEAEAAASQSESVGAEDFKKALTALKDLSTRVTDLEKLMKNIDTNLSALNKIMTAETNIKAPGVKGRKPKSSEPTK